MVGFVTEKHSRLSHADIRDAAVEAHVGNRIYQNELILEEAVQPNELLAETVMIVVVFGLYNNRIKITTTGLPCISCPTACAVKN